VKITDIRTHVVDAFRANYVFVVVDTDAGISGVGEATVEHGEPAVAAQVIELARGLAGADPFAVEHHVEMMSRGSYWRTGVTIRSALAGIEAALLDIKGKALGVPVYDLLGGRQRDRVPAYANGWFVGAREPGEFAAKAAAAVELGFKALKWDPFGTAYLTMDRAARNNAVAKLRAVREAVGPDIELMIEVHGRFNVPTAIALAHEFAPYRPYWFEEPVPPESIAALADVRAKSPVPIAAGERYYEPARFAELIEARAVDYLQPDISHVGGLLEAKRIAAMAHARYLPVCPHNPIGPVANAMTLQLAAAIPNFAWLEMMMSDVPWRAEIVAEDLVFEDGCMLIPDRPGLGVTLHEAACRAHPFAPHALRHYAGTLTDIRPPGATVYYRRA
jgi:galactonate dehydratase